MVDAQEAAFRGTFLVHLAHNLEPGRWKCPETRDFRKTGTARKQPSHTTGKVARPACSLDAQALHGPQDDLRSQILHTGVG